MLYCRGSRWAEGNSERCFKMGWRWLWWEGVNRKSSKTGRVKAGLFAQTLVPFGLLFSQNQFEADRLSLRSCTALQNWKNSSKLSCFVFLSLS